MIDTVTIKNYYNVLPNGERLIDKGWKGTTNSRLPTWIRNRKDGSHKPRLTISITPDSVVHLQAEVSLPKMLFGNNARLPTEKEVWEGLDQIADYAQQESGYRFSLQTALVRRIDYTKDFDVGEDKVIPIIAHLASKTIPRHNRIFFNDTSLYFRSFAKTKEIRLYSKMHEVLTNQSVLADVVEMARGRLRVECSYLEVKTLNALTKKLKLPDRIADCLLRKDISDRVITEIENTLDLTNLQDKSDSVIASLLKRFGARRAMRLLGFLEFIRHFGEHFHKNDSLGVSKDAYHRDASDCRKAKVWLDEEKRLE